MIETTTTCDICGEKKKEVNHWFIAALYNGWLKLSLDNDYDRDGFSIDVCGQACVHTLVDRWLTTGRLEK